MSARMVISDLSPRHQAEVTAQLNGGKPLGVARAKAVGAVEVVGVKRKLRQKSGPELNKTEAAFYEWLKANTAGDAYPHGFTLKIANGVRYTPDFTVLYDTGAIRCYEVKGFMRDDAAVKIKVAASVFRKIFFTLATLKKGVWQFEEVRS